MSKNTNCFTRVAVCLYTRRGVARRDARRVGKISALTLLFERRLSPPGRRPARAFVSTAHRAAAAAVAAAAEMSAQTEAPSAHAAFRLVTATRVLAARITPQPPQPSSPSPSSSSSSSLPPSAFASFDSLRAMQMDDKRLPPPPSPLIRPVVCMPPPRVEPCELNPINLVSKNLSCFIFKRPKKVLHIFASIFVAWPTHRFSPFANRERQHSAAIRSRLTATSRESPRSRQFRLPYANFVLLLLANERGAQERRPKMQAAVAAEVKRSTLERRFDSLKKRCGFVVILFLSLLTVRSDEQWNFRFDAGCCTKLQNFSIQI